MRGCLHEPRSTTAADVLGEHVEEVVDDPATCHARMPAWWRGERQLEHRRGVDHAGRRSSSPSNVGRRSTPASRHAPWPHRGARGGRASTRCSGDPDSRRRRSRSPGCMCPCRTSDRSTTAMVNPRRDRTPRAPLCRGARRPAADERGTRPGDTLRPRPRRSRRSSRERACPPRRSRGRRAAPRPVTRCRRPTWRRSRRRSCGTARQPGDDGLGSDPSVEATRSGSLCPSLPSEKSPPNPPTSPTTSGWNVVRTCCLMNSTAFSPAATSTPASR